ncbi:hypothetical protein BJV74DRAFT_882327 [Russula compacta]|nr:hypothetical protein BJV74DRAFT_882327 [Russula compacta]
MVLVVGLQRPDAVTRSRRTFYCSLESRIISLVSIGFTSTTSFVAIGIAATMSYQLCSFLRLLSRARQPQIRVIPLAIRLIIFMVYLFFAVATSLWSIQDHHTYIRDIYTSTFAVAYFLVFGTQRDVFRAWCFWRQDWRKDATEAGSGTSETGARIADAEDVTISVAAGQAASVASFSGTAHGLHSVFSRCNSFTAKNLHIIVTSTIDTDDSMTDISQSYTSQNFCTEAEESGGVPTAV